HLRPVLLEHVEDGRSRGDDGYGERCAEEEAPRVVLDEVDDVALPEQDSADAAERLRERRHEHGDAVEQPRLLEDAGAALAEGPGPVRVIDDEDRFVAVADLDELGEVRLVAVERVDALDEDERVLALARLQDALEALGRVVIEEAHLRRAAGDA